MKTHETKEIIKIVHYKEAEALFKSIVSLGKPEGEIICYLCKTKITSRNFKALTQKSGKILFCCDNPECYRLFVKSLRK